MDINYIREFVVLADTCSFVDTAEQLFIAQSSLSKHIKTLEQELGVSLFERTSRKVKLNEFGKLFLPYARRIIGIQEQYTVALAEQKSRMSDYLVIGTLSMMVQYNITELLAKFKKKYPNITIAVREGEHLKEMLQDGQCDLAFMRDDGHDCNDFEKVLYCEDSVSAVLPRNHALAGQPHISLEQLKDENFLMLPENTVVSGLAIQLCRKAGFNPRVAMSVRKGESLIDLIGNGMGVALLMRTPTLYLKNSDVVLVDIRPAVPMNVYLMRYKNRQLSPAGQIFLQYMKSTASLSV